MVLQLKRYRKRIGISQAELARQLDVDIKTIGNWERGKTVPDAEQLWNCSLLLKTNPNDLIGWYEEHPEDLPAKPAGAEGELLYCYRQSSEGRRTKILETARDQAELSQAQDTGAEGEGLDPARLRTA